MAKKIACPIINIFKQLNNFIKILLNNLEEIMELIILQAKFLTKAKIY